jgi:hypothetical protein
VVPQATADAKPVRAWRRDSGLDDAFDIGSRLVPQARVSFRLADMFYQTGCMISQAQAYKWRIGPTLPGRPPPAAPGWAHYPSCNRPKGRRKYVLGSGATEGKRDDIPEQ